LAASARARSSRRTTLALASSKAALTMVSVCIPSRLARPSVCSARELDPGTDDLAFSVSSPWVRHQPPEIVGRRRVGVEGINGKAGPADLEEALLAPAGEHRVGSKARVGVVARRDDLGLVTALLVEADYLSAGEVALVGVIGDADPPVGEQVAVFVTGLVNKDVLKEGRAGKQCRGTLVIGEDVEAALDELAEQLGRPAAPVEADRRAGRLTEQFADAPHDLFQLARQACPRWRLPDEEAVAEAVRDVGVHLGRMEMRMRARWPFGNSPWP